MSKINSYSFSIAKYQFLNEFGQLSDDAPDWASDFDQVLTAYRGMLFSRAFDEKAINLQRTGLLRTYPPAIGQEAVGVGLGLAMSEHDIMCSYYRDHPTHLLRGITPEEVFRFWGGYEDGNVFQHPSRKNDLPICVPIGTQSLHAVGVAYAQQMKYTDVVTVTTIGDGGTSQGDYYEALNAAGHWNLPLVFIVNNNQWAISIPRKAQTATETLAQKAIAAGIEGVIVDGNDVVAMQTIAQQAIDKARKGLGPTLIEAQTYRLCDHTTADDATRYMPANERKDAEMFEPIKRLKIYLQNQFDWNEPKDQSLIKEIKQQIQAATDRYLQLKPEPIGIAWENLYQDLPIQYQDQKQAWIKREKKLKQGVDNER